MTSVTMKELLAAGVHFGHQTRRWNPKMRRFIFGKKSGIYIIDLRKTLESFEDAADYVREMGRTGRRLFLRGGVRPELHRTDRGSRRGLREQPP